MQAWSGPPSPCRVQPPPLLTPVAGAGQGGKRFGDGEKSVQSKATGAAPCSWGSHAGAGWGAGTFPPSSWGLCRMGGAAKLSLPHPCQPAGLSGGRHLLFMRGMSQPVMQGKLRQGEGVWLPPGPRGPEGRSQGTPAGDLGGDLVPSPPPLPTLCLWLTTCPGPGHEEAAGAGECPQDRAIV